MTEWSAGSTVPRRELGRQLRRLREEAGITIAHAAKEMETSSPRIWRIEKGVIPMRSGEVRLMCELYGADDEVTAGLMALAKETKAPEWWRVYGDAIPEWLDLFLGLEQAASDFRWWEPQLVPGILQTLRYATAVMEADESMSPSDVELRVKARLDRQSLLTRKKPPRYDLIVDEDVLHRPVVDRIVMVEQFDRLLEASSLPHVTLRVVPRSAGLHQGIMSGPFMIMDFPKPRNGTGEPTTVYTDSWITSLYFSKPHEVARYVEAFEVLTRRSLDPSASRDLIRDLRERL